MTTLAARASPPITFVSDNGGSFQPWLTSTRTCQLHTQVNSATLRLLQRCHRKCGHQEAAPTVADTQTVVLSSGTSQQIVTPSPVTSTVVPGSAISIDVN